MHPLQLLILALTYTDSVDFATLRIPLLALVGLIRAPVKSLALLMSGRVAGRVHGRFPAAAALKHQYFNATQSNNSRNMAPTGL